MVAAALETVGVGSIWRGLCIRTVREGNPLAQDLLEELRPVLADRFVLTLINRKMVTKKGLYKKKEDGAVLMGDQSIKLLLDRMAKQEKGDYNPSVLQREKVEWGNDTICAGDAVVKDYLRGDISMNIRHFSGSR